MSWWKRHKECLLVILLLILFSLPVVLPLFRHGFFQTDDGEWMVIRFSAFHQALRDGQFPVRWLGRLNQEYGYPVANFLYPGFMYLAEIPKVIGFDYVDSVKIILIFSLFGSAVFTFFWLKQIFTPLSAFMGAIFYLYTPYHLWDVYKRGSVGEILALAVVPFILWMIEKKNWFFYSFGIGLLILAHNTLAILFLPIIIIYGLLKKLNKQSFSASKQSFSASKQSFSASKQSFSSNTKDLILHTVLGFGLAAFFWLPAIYDLQYTKFFQTTVSSWQNYFVNFSLIGWETIIIFLTAIPFCFNDIYQYSKLTKLFLIVGLGTLFFSLPQSNFVWQYLPVSFIQFPFRLLSITILCGAFLTAFVIGRIGKLKILLTLILIAIIFLCAKPYLQPTVFFDKGEGFYTTNEGTTTVQNEYMPIWVQEIPINKPKEKVAIIFGEGKIDNLQTNAKKTSFTLEAKTNLEIELNTLYFPGWQVWVDKQKMTVDYRNTEGLIKFKVKPGSHQIMIEFSETPVRLIADIISFVSLLAILGLALKKR